jgi:hypothetical protein
MNIYQQNFDSLQGKILFVESLPSFFIISGADLALQLVQRGHEVYFCYISTGCLSQDFDFSLPKKVLGCNVERHLCDLFQILSSNGVKVVEPPNLDPEVLIKCEKFGSSVPAETEQLDQLLYDDIYLGMSVRSILISTSKNSRVSIKNKKDLVRKKLETSAIIYERTMSLIASINPDSLVLFNGRTPTSFPVEQAAIKFDVKCFWREVCSNGNLITLHDKKIHDTNYISELIENIGSDIDEITLEKMALDFYIKYQENSLEINFLNRIKENKLPEIKRENNIFVFFHTSEDEFLAVSRDDAGIFDSQEDAIHAIDSFFDNYPGRYQFFLRVHPHLQYKAKEEREYWNNFKLKNGSVIPSFSDVDSKTLLQEANCVITYGSSLTCRANYMAVPVILLDFTSIFSMMRMAHEPQSLQDLHDLLLTVPKLSTLDSKPSKYWAYYCITEPSLGIPFRYFYHNQKTNTMIYQDGLSLSMQSPIFSLIRLLYKKVVERLNWLKRVKMWPPMLEVSHWFSKR